MSRSNFFAVQQRETSNNLGVSLLLSINEQSTLFTFYILVVLILHVKIPTKATTVLPCSNSQRNRN